MHSPAYLQDVLILLAVAVAIVAGFRFLRLSPVIGYLVAGAAIGPYGFGLIRDVHSTASLGEFGVVLMLFVIGLELSLKRLRDMRSQVFGFGTLQVICTAVLIGSVAHLFGLPMEQSILIGGGLAFSSTALVLQVVSERGDQSTQVGRLALAVLILQDLAVVPLLILIPHFRESDAANLTYVVGETLLKTATALIVIFIAGRLLIRPLYHTIAATRSSELFAATTLLVVLGCSYATQQVGLSLALGAFLAGLLVAETEFHHQVEADIMPYRDLLMGLFFMTVGMSVDFEIILNGIWLIIPLVLGLMLMKSLVIGGLCRLFRFDWQAAAQAGLLLSQGSEFAFVLFSLATNEGLLPPQLSQLLLVVVTLSMALTPFAADFGRRIARMIASHQAGGTDGARSQMSDLNHHVIIAGYGRMGQTIARILEMERMAYVAVDLDPQSVANARKEKKPVYYGDARRPEVLHAVGIDRADIVICTFSNTPSLARTIRAIKRVRVGICIVSRCQRLSHAKLLEAAGADIVVSETLESSLDLSRALLQARHTPEKEIVRVLQEFRDRVVPELKNGEV